MPTGGADLAAYEALALRLATEPGLLAGVRAKLAANRATCALFNTDHMRRHLESAYATMHARHLRGEARRGWHSLGDVARQTGR